MPRKVSLVCALLVIGCGSTADNNDLPDGAMRDGSIDGGGDGGGDAGDGSVAMCELDAARAGELGGPCRGAGQCNTGLGCEPERVLEVGGPDDPITDYPAGENVPFETSLFPGDYCLAAFGTTLGVCTADEEDACDSVCGVCVGGYFANADACLRKCEPSVADNSTCRDGYTCDLVLKACDIGCQSDPDCRVFRIDGTLAYDSDSEATCNLATHRCEFPGNSEAEAGDACADDEDCEANGDCLPEDFGFAGGYCTKFGCDVTGNACAGDAICHGRAFTDLFLCLQACDVGAGATPGEPETYLNNTQGCSEGYACQWAGGNNDNGGCLPANFNDQDEPNIGAACESSDECYSPFGQGACLVGFGCSVLDCGVPGIPNDVCGDDALCVLFGQSDTICLKECSAAEECLPDQACIDLDGDPLSVDDRACTPFCFEDSECRAGEVCNQDTLECEPTT